MSERCFSPAELTKHALQTWPELLAVTWNFGVTLHFPYRLAQCKSEHASNERQKHLARYLNALDRHYFGNAVCRQGKKRFKKFVIEEFVSGAGFHIHMVMCIPTDIDLIDLDEKMRRRWFKSWPRNSFRIAQDDVFWADEITGGLQNYITKYIGTGGADMVGRCTNL